MNLINFIYNYFIIYYFIFILISKFNLEIYKDYQKR